MSSALVLAKAPVPGQAKTRLGRQVGMAVAAELAAAALLDTLAACAEAFGRERCHLSLAGDLVDAVRGTEIREALRGWTVRSQRGTTFAERIANAHLETSPAHAGVVVQVGMDTPHATAQQLRAVAAKASTYDAVLGPAQDGGWWVLAQRDAGAARALLGVPMSTADTHVRTRDAIVASGLSVGEAALMRDVDDADDAAAVATLAPATRFARSWRTLVGGD